MAFDSLIEASKRLHAIEVAAEQSARKQLMPPPPPRRPMGIEQPQSIPAENPITVLSHKIKILEAEKNILLEQLSPTTQTGLRAVNLRMNSEIMELRKKIHELEATIIRLEEHQASIIEARNVFIDRLNNKIKPAIQATEDRLKLALQENDQLRKRIKIFEEGLVPKAPILIEGELELIDDFHIEDGEANFII
jgi:hypothetical protein